MIENLLSSKLQNFGLYCYQTDLRGFVCQQKCFTSGVIWFSSKKTTPFKVLVMIYQGFIWKSFSKNLNKFMLNTWNWTCGCLTQEYSHRKRIISSGEARIPSRTGYWKSWVAKAFAELKIENPDTSSKKWKCAHCLRS